MELNLIEALKFLHEENQVHSNLVENRPHLSVLEVEQGLEVQQNHRQAAFTVMTPLDFPSLQLLEAPVVVDGVELFVHGKQLLEYMREEYRVQ